MLLCSGARPLVIFSFLLLIKNVLRHDREKKCREPLKIAWEEPLALAAPRTASWESTQPDRVGSLSVFGVLHSEADVESDPFAALAVYP